MNDKLIKKITEILADYKFNSTQTETAEMNADRIINIVKQEALKEVEKILDELKGILISRVCCPNKSVNTFQNAREIKEVITEEIDELKTKLDKLKEAGK